MKKRFGSILLAFAMVFSLLPWSAQSAQAAGSGTQTTSWNGIVTGDMVYMGKENGGKPIAWRVLSLPGDDQLPVSNAGQVLLISKYTQGEECFGYSTDWADSNVKTWCTNFDKNNPSGLSDAEKAAIAATSVTETSGYTYIIDGSTCSTDYGPASLNKERFFLLSAEEANKYFANDNARVAYASADDEKSGKASQWWLRSPSGTDEEYAGSEYAGSVSSDGQIDIDYIYDSTSSMRPAFNLTASNVLFAAPAYGKNNGTEIRPLESESHEWKLTLRDTSRTGFSATCAQTALDAGDEVAVSYSGARTGEGEYVSILMYDDEGALLGYASAAVTAASGKATFTLPYVSDGSYTLRVFNEQRNDNYLSDYAGNIVERTVTLSSTSSAPGGSPETAYEIKGKTEAEAWKNLSNALAENGTTRTDGEDAKHTTYFKLMSNCTATEDDSYIEVGYKRYVVLDLNGNKIDRGLANESAPLDHGCVIRVQYGASLTITDSTAKPENPAGNGVITGGYGKYGGGISVSSGTSDLPSLTLRGGTITGNRALNYGGGVYMGYGKLVLCGGAITENRAIGDGNPDSASRAGSGGGVYCDKNCAALTIESGTISGNTAYKYGGGIYTDGSDGVGAVLTINGGAITGNKAMDGGGMRVAARTVINDGEISENKALSGGGVSAGGDVMIRGGKIKNNTATETGGGIAADWDITLIGGEISGNQANDGGGVYMDNDGLLTMKEGSRIVGNSAVNGGGVYKYSVNRDVNDDPSQIAMMGGEISGNNAEVGGGVYLERSRLTMTGGRITGNNASGNGGGVYYRRRIDDKDTALNVSGSPVITGNVGGGAENNVFLERNGTYNETQVTVTAALTGEALIGVSFPKEKIRKMNGETVPNCLVTAANGRLTAADLAHFTSDYPEYVLGLYEYEGGVTAEYFPIAFSKTAVTARRGSVLLLAQYDADGKMTALQSKKLTKDVMNATPASLGITLPKSGVWKLMLLDRGDLRPALPGDQRLTQR
ncbi:MAG: hypothetical protein J5449_11975 [Oscillospiraceae bacterium]|nr:hypothetical protein [Oscillospiraceae bacterium]